MKIFNIINKNREANDKAPVRPKTSNILYSKAIANWKQGFQKTKAPFINGPLPSCSSTNVNTILNKHNEPLGYFKVTIHQVADFLKIEDFLVNVCITEQGQNFSETGSLIFPCSKNPIYVDEFKKEVSNLPENYAANNLSTTLYSCSLSLTEVSGYLNIAIFSHRSLKSVNFLGRCSLSVTEILQLLLSLISNVDYLKIMFMKQTLPYNFPCIVCWLSLLPSKDNVSKFSSGIPYYPESAMLRPKKSLGKIKVSISFTLFKPILKGFVPKFSYAQNKTHFLSSEIPQVTEKADLSFKHSEDYTQSNYQMSYNDMHKSRQNELAYATVTSSNNLSEYEESLSIFDKKVWMGLRRNIRRFKLIISNKNLERMSEKITNFPWCLGVIVYFWYLCLKAETWEFPLLLGVLPLSILKFMSFNNVHRGSDIIIRKKVEGGKGDFIEFSMYPKPPGYDIIVWKEDAGSEYTIRERYKRIKKKMFILNELSQKLGIFCSFLERLLSLCFYEDPLISNVYFFFFFLLCLFSSLLIIIISFRLILFIILSSLWIFILYKKRGVIKTKFSNTRNLSFPNILNHSFSQLISFKKAEQDDNFNFIKKYFEEEKKNRGVIKKIATYGKDNPSLNEFEMKGKTDFDKGETSSLPGEISTNLNEEKISFIEHQVSTFHVSSLYEKIPDLPEREHRFISKLSFYDNLFNRK
jgi:hypothetical protein